MICKEEKTKRKAGRGKERREGSKGKNLYTYFASYVDTSWKCIIELNTTPTIKPLEANIWERFSNILLAKNLNITPEHILNGKI